MPSSGSRILAPYRLSTLMLALLTLLQAALLPCAFTCAAYVGVLCLTAVVSSVITLTGLLIEPALAGWLAAGALGAANTIAFVTLGTGQAPLADHAAAVWLKPLPLAVAITGAAVAITSVLTLRHGATHRARRSAIVQCAADRTGPPQPSPEPASAATTPPAPVTHS